MNSANDVVIRVSDLSKMFKLYPRPADMFWELVTGRPRYQEFWALNHISFEIRRGQVVGIVGRNGAGKSTLLKILAGTLDKTGGEVEVRGKIAALLELGSGFNFEYTGRENIHVGGLVLGMSAREVEEKTEIIVDFAELSEYIDRPFKTYSTGMQARLAFAVAISVDPDILIVDEALAVGDTLFQEKCFRRIREIVVGGTTVLFVSHALGTIYELCHEAILLSKGGVLLRDKPRNVGYAYEQLLAEDRYNQQQRGCTKYKPATTIRAGDLSVSGQSSGMGKAALQPSAEAPFIDLKLKTAVQTDSPRQRPEIEAIPNTKAVIKGIQVLNEQGTGVTTLYGGECYIIRVEAYCLEDIQNLSVGILINLPTGLTVYGKGSWLDVELPCKSGESVTVDFWLPDIALASGTYVLNAVAAEAFNSIDYTIWHYLRDAAHIQVVGNDRCMGVVDLKAKVRNIERYEQGMIQAVPAE